MTAIPSSNAEWVSLINEVKAELPERFVSQRAIPLDFPRLIDHTLLSQPTFPEQIDKLCAEARERGFVAVCVRPEHVARAKSQLKDTPSTAVASVVAFPEGTQATADKVHEAKGVVDQGATEIDMVINYPLLKEGNYQAVYDDINAVRTAVPCPIKLKTIIECSQLDREQMIAATVVCCRAQADFVKTSTGVNGPGADVDSVTLLYLVSDICAGDCKVKASGGIRTASSCLGMVKAGAARIGTSAGISILKELDEGELLEQGAGHTVT